MTSKTQNQTEDYDDPLTWMLTMEMARQRGNFEQAAYAKKRLERLGVRVTYRRPIKMRKGVTNDPH